MTAIAGFAVLAASDVRMLQEFGHRLRRRPVRVAARRARRAAGRARAGRAARRAGRGAGGVARRAGVSAAEPPLVAVAVDAARRRRASRAARLDARASAARPRTHAAGAARRGCALLADRFRGAEALALRTRPVPAAYRVLFRQLGLDPDVTRTPVEALAVERLLRGGLAPRGLPEDALALATLETGVPGLGVRRRARRRRARAARPTPTAGSCSPTPRGRSPCCSRRPRRSARRAARRARCCCSPCRRRASTTSSSRRRVWTAVAALLQLTPRHDRSPARSARRPPVSRSRSRPPRRHRTASSTSSSRYGPVKITPGQNTIAFERNDQRAGRRRLDRRLPARPRAPRRQRPARRRDPPAPRRLAHEPASRCSRPARRRPLRSRPPATAGATARATAGDMNHMIHNLTPTPEEVFITYEIDFIPDGSPAAQGIQEIETAWLDTVGGAYPVFDAKRGNGGARRPLHLPGRGAGRAAQPLDRARGRRARRHRRAPASGRAVDRPEAHARRAHRRACSAPRRSTSSRPARSPGTSP